MTALRPPDARSTQGAFFVKFVLRSFLPGGRGGRERVFPPLGDAFIRGRSPRTRPKMAVGLNQGENSHLDVIGEVRPRLGEGLGDASGVGLGCTWDASGMHRNRSHWVLSGAFCSLSRIRGDLRIPWIC